MLKDALVALSLSNLCFVSAWQLLLVEHPFSAPFYHWKVHPGPLFLAAVLDVLLLASLFWGAMTLARRTASRRVLRVAHFSFLLALLIPVFNFTPLVQELVSFLKDEPSLLWRTGSNLASLVRKDVLFVLMLGLIVVGVCVIQIRKGRPLARFFAKVVLVLSPLVAVWFYQGLVLWMRSPAAESAARGAAVEERDGWGERRGGRVLWLVFDEWDYQLSFTQRPASVQLPEFDRLRGEAVFAANAYPPAGDTVLSLPALITGRLVARAHRTAHDELMLNFSGGEADAPWSREPNVFTGARASGFKTGLAGWYHPYCRVIGNSLDTCSWEAEGAQGSRDPETIELVSSSEQRSLGASMLSLALKALWTVPLTKPLLPSEGELVRRYQIAEFSRLEEQGRRMATDPRLGMVVIHLPIPHPVGIYDRSAQTFSLNQRSGYLDNLALADRTLGELRRAMEQAGLWDNTTVLVTSDHWLRLERVWRRHRHWRPPVTVGGNDGLPRGDMEHRVPFILKLAGQRTPLVYERPFNSVLARDLSLAILRGEVSSPEGIAQWLDRHRTIGESPYVEGEK